MMGVTKMSLTNPNPGNVLYSGEVFKKLIPTDCRKIEFLYGENSGTIKVGNNIFAEYCGNILTVKSLNRIYANADCSCMFEGPANEFDYDALESIIFDNFDTSNVRTMHGMFGYRRNIDTLNLNTFDTGNVIDMSNMFINCESLQNLYIDNFDTSKVETMESMFSFLPLLSKLNVSNFNTSNVKSMAFMFLFCCTLKNLDLDKFDMSNVRDVRLMFDHCNAVTSSMVQNFNLKDDVDKSNIFG